MEDIDYAIGSSMNRLIFWDRFDYRYFVTIYLFVDMTSPTHGSLVVYFDWIFYMVDFMVEKPFTFYMERS